MGRSKIPEGRKILPDAREREREEEGLEKRLKAVVIREGEINNVSFERVS